MLNRLLAHGGLTLNNLPMIAAHVNNGANELCYNFVLGKCVHTACTHHHVDTAEITDAFAMELIDKLRPVILDYTTANGVPRGSKCRRT